MKKIYTLDKLKNISFSLKKKSKKIVLCHGVFDLIHIGHVKYFESAKKNYDYKNLNLSFQVSRVLVSYIDYVNREIWKKN